MTNKELIVLLLQQPEDAPVEMTRRDQIDPDWISSCEIEDVSMSEEGVIEIRNYRS